MNKIIRKEQFSEKVYRFDIEAPLIAKSRKAGNFVIVRVGDKGERMPLTIADADTTKGTITLVVQKVGLSSIKLCNLTRASLLPMWLVRWAIPRISKTLERLSAQAVAWVCHTCCPSFVL